MIARFYKATWHFQWHVKRVTRQPSCFDARYIWVENSKTLMGITVIVNMDKITKKKNIKNIKEKKKDGKFGVKRQGPNLPVLATCNSQRNWWETHDLNNLHWVEMPWYVLLKKIDKVDCFKKIVNKTLWKTGSFLAIISKKKKK